MDISMNRNDAKLEVMLSGRLDTLTSPELEARLKADGALDGVSDLVLDLTDVQYVSSAGLRVILFAHKEMSSREGTLVVRHPNEYIADVFEATGFSDILSIES